MRSTICAVSSSLRRWLRTLVDTSAQAVRRRRKASGSPRRARLEAAFAADELVELVCLAGFYHLVSFVCGAFAVPAEPWAVSPPA